MPKGREKDRQDDGSTTLRSLEDLRNVVVMDKLQLPEEELPELDGEAIRAKAEERRQNITQIGQWIPTRLAWLEQAALLPREEHDFVESKITEVQKDLDDLLSHPNEAYRRVAWASALDFQFKRSLKSQTQVEALLRRLVSEKQLVRVKEASDGFLRAYGQSYTVPSQAAFEGPEEIKIRQTLVDLMRRAQEAETHADLSWEDLLAGKQGSKGIGVPPEHVVDKQKGEEYWRPGCQLRILSNGKRFWVIRGTARNEKLQQAIGLTVSLKVNLDIGALPKLDPPSVKHLNPEVPKKIQLLYHLVRRAWGAEAERRALMILKRQMAARATFTPEQFFQKGLPGSCLVDLENPWEDRDQEGHVVKVYYDVFFLVTRSIVKGKEWPRIDFDPDDPEKVPIHIREYLSRCKGTHPEGEKFQGCPYPLRGMLQAAFGQTVKTARMNGGNNS